MKTYTGEVLDVSGKTQSVVVYKGNNILYKLKGSEHNRPMSNFRYVNVWYVIPLFGKNWLPQITLECGEIFSASSGNPVRARVN